MYIINSMVQGDGFRVWRLRLYIEFTAYGLSVG